MKEFFFILSTLLVLSCTFAASVSLCAYLVTRRKVYIAWIVLMAGFLTDYVMTVFEEYVPATLAFQDYGAPGEVENMGIKLIASVAIVFAAWYLVARQLEWDRGPRFAVVPAVTSVLLAVAAVAKPPFDSGHVDFYLVRDVYLIVCLVVMLVAGLRSGNMKVREAALRETRCIVSCIVLMVLALLMDMTSLDPVYYALWPGGLSGTGAELYFYLVRRNVFEIAVVVLYIIMVIASGSSTLALRFSRPVVTEQFDYASSEVRLNRFVKRYGLSEREQEILVRLLDGASFQRIASDFYLSLGTVKAHASHIYSKTGVNGRQDLLQLFWRE